MSQGIGPVAQPYIRIEPVGHGASYSSAAIVFGFITMLLLSVMIGYFGRRFHRSWGKGAHGKQLLFETLDME